MYEVKVLYEGEFYPLYIPGVEELALMEPELTTEMGCAGNFSFRILPVHPYADKIHPLSSEIYVYKDGEEVFRGRYVGKEEDFFRTGKVSCEGELAYLLDSQQRAYTHEGSIRDFLAARLAAHNSAVEERKRFALGRVTVVDSNNYINRSSESLSNTLECLKGKLVETHGGYLRTRLEGGKRYLDYVTDYGGINSQTIRFGENILDLSKYIDAASVITALIPIGASVEVANPDGTIDNRRVDITSINGGSDYIYDAHAVQKYGWITGTHEWEDVTLPENLVRKARAYLEDCISLPVTIELTAVDLSLVDVDVDALKVGYWTEIVSEPHGVKGTYLLTKKTVYLTDPERDTVVLGGKLASFTGSSVKKQMDMSLRVQQVAESASREINAKVENATQLITGGLGGYIVIGRAEDGHPEEILIMDAPTKEAAKNVIRLNRNGIGFSTSGYNGVYRNAWTIDGNLVADFVTTGSMLADRIRGGTLEVGGKGLGKDGQITLKDKDGGILAVMDRNGMDIRKGSIVGSTIVLGGRGNVQGNMTVNAADGGVVCSIGGAGLYAIRGTVGGWDITDDLLSSEKGMIASYEGTNHSNRATMNNASFKTWVGGAEKCYMGRGGYNGRGSENAGLLFVSGYGGGIELDGNSGKVNAGGDMEAQGRIKAHGGMECEGSFSVSGRVYMTDSMEVSHDLMCGGRVDAQNISDLAGRIETLERKIGK